MRAITATCAATVMLFAATSGALAQSLTDSFTAAYTSNPSLNAARSALRSVDENIAIARSGNRPNLSASLSQSWQTSRVVALRTRGERTAPTSIGVTLVQPLFRGFQTRNSIREAEAAVLAQRMSLLNTEQDILLDTATSFFDIIEDRQIVKLRRDDVSFLGAQVRAAQDRFEVGEGTRTDVSQAEARQASAETLLIAAVATLEGSEASYRQLTGLTARRLINNINDARFIPASLKAAVNIGQQGHPAILSNLHSVDQSIFAVARLEGQYLPSLDLVGDASTVLDAGSGVNQRDEASISLNLTVPLYQGGRVSAEVRQAKEDLGTARINVDVTRDSVRQFTVTAWADYQAAVRSIQTARTGVFAAQLALQGVIEEQRVGQRTTLDVLDQQSELVAAQITLVTAERNRDVAAYNLLSSIGRLNAQRLKLRVALYNPAAHTDAVRDKWFGFRTPDGR